MTFLHVCVVCVCACFLSALAAPAVWVCVCDGVMQPYPVNHERTACLFARV